MLRGKIKKCQNEQFYYIYKDVRSVQGDMELPSI